MNQKTLNIIYGIVIVVLIGTVVYFVVGKKSEQVVQQPPPTPTQTQIPVSPTPTPTPNPTANWKTYTNSQYGFEFKYPNEWNATSGINIKGPLNGYIYINPPAGESFTYNSQSSTWTADSRTLQANAPISKTTGSVKWFLTGMADSLAGVSIALVPDSNSDVMVEIVINDQVSQKLIQILSTFKFTK
ncbi:MAG: hypothetical protein HYX21_02755 [Candidatus Yanofskybacteria bacterium]|nr:hypothetical protein [Candidatus Yanofskybacteria bacterium]